MVEDLRHLELLELVTRIDDHAPRLVALEQRLHELPAERASAAGDQDRFAVKHAALCHPSFTPESRQARVGPRGNCNNVAAPVCPAMDSPWSAGMQINTLIWQDSDGLDRTPSDLPSRPQRRVQQLLRQRAGQR